MTKYQPETMPLDSFNVFIMDPGRMEGISGAKSVLILLPQDYDREYGKVVPLNGINIQLYRIQRFTDDKRIDPIDGTFDG